MQKLTGISIAIFILVSHATLFAQSSLEFDINYGIGVSELTFNSVPGIGISFYPFKNFGVSTGAQYSWRWQSQTNSYSGSTPAVDDEGDSFIFKYSVKKYEEEWKARILQIPILFKYNDDFYYAAAGVKIGIPLSAQTDISYKGLHTEGYYPQFNVTLPVPEFQGFGDKEGSDKTKISKIKTLIMLAVEGGVRLKLTDNFSILAGAFADYSINNGFDRTTPPVIERIQNAGNATLVANDTWDAWQPWSVGATVKFAFSFGFGKKEPQPIEEDSTVQETPNITVAADSLPPPVAVEGSDPQFEDFVPVTPLPVPNDYAYVAPLPSFLVGKAPDFVFNYPEANTSPNYTPHNILIAQIAEALRANPDSRLHCVGYSEKLASDFFAYETALQRALRIRQILSNLYGIDEARVIVYSLGSSNSGGSNSSVYRTVECFLIEHD